MSTLAQVLDGVRQEKTLVESMATLIGNLQTQIKAIPELSTDQQASVDQIFGTVSDSIAEATAAVAANTVASTGVPDATGATNPSVGHATTASNVGSIPAGADPATGAVPT